MADKRNGIDDIMLILNGFSFTNFGKGRYNNLCNTYRKREPDKREETSKTLDYLTGFGFSRVGRSHGQKGQNPPKVKRKRDSVVGISQWGKRSTTTYGLDTQIVFISL